LGFGTTVLHFIVTT